MTHPLAHLRLVGVSDHHLVREALQDATVTRVVHVLSVSEGIDRLTLHLEKHGRDIGPVVISALQGQRLDLELGEDGE
jgi:hypothetical protein